jgi:hypothetical protein
MPTLSLPRRRQQIPSANELDAAGRSFWEQNLHVEDEGAFTMPWNAIQRYKRVEPGVAERDIPVENDATSAVGIARPLQEVTCSETTVSYFGDMLPIPQAEKPDF